MFFVSQQRVLGRRSAATLVEIVAVIAIISIMAGLSFYMFSSAKGFADRIASDANMAVATIGAKTGTKPSSPSSNSTTGTTGHAAPPRPQRIPGQYFVAFNSSVTNPNANALRLASLVGGQVLMMFNSSLVYGFGLQCSDDKIAQVRTDPAVKFVDQARYVYPCQGMPKTATPNVLRVFSNQGYDNGSATPNKLTPLPPSIYRIVVNQTTQPLINSRPFLPGSTNAVSTVAIMDTGIDNTHPALSVISAVDFTGGGNPMDLDGHGTHVAGVVGAINVPAGTGAPNGGVIGVYPGAPLINLKVMGANNNSEIAVGSNLVVYNALLYVINNASAIRVCLMAFQTAPVDPIMNSLVNAAANSGVMMVVAAGGGDPAPPPAPVDVATVSPASASFFLGGQAIVVGAFLDNDSVRTVPPVPPEDSYGPYSNFGSGVVFAAPGGDMVPGAGFYQIWSTIPVNNPNNINPPYHDHVNGITAPGNGRPAYGTSFAAAHVAGMLAYMRDTQTICNFIIGNHTIPSYAFQMQNAFQAITSLNRLTRNPYAYQVGYTVSGIHPIIVRPRVWTFDNADRVNDGKGHVINIPNFYKNS